MSETMKKAKFFVSFAKEEAFLRQMAAEGWYFTKRGLLTYHFTRGEPGDAVFRIDYRSFDNTAAFNDYVALFADAGWRHRYGDKSSGAQYFVKLGAESDDDIFSDHASRAARYKRLSAVWVALLCSYLPLFTIFMSNGMIDFGLMLNPGAAWQTPGLWQMTGFDFWRAFLFELPFVFMRTYFWLIIPIMLVVIAAYLLAMRRAERREQ